jgi:hypothetical protein
MRPKAIAFSGFAIALFTVPAVAHHTHAMFDFTRTVELNGTVKDFKWTNPHSWLHVMAANPRGEMVEYTIEMSAPASLVSRGWKPTTVVPGDKVLITIYPTKNGGNGGTLKAAKLADGTALGQDYEGR